MPGGVINTGSHPKALWPGVRAWWGQTYNAYATEYADLYDWDSSGRAYEEDVQVTGFGLAPIKEEGGAGSYDSEQQGFVTQYPHIAYFLGWKVTYEERQDNLYKQLAMRRSRANAFSINQTIENVAAAVYNDAFTGSFFLMPDSQPLLSASHVNVTGGTFSNILNPGVTLSEAGLEDMGILIMGAQTDRGLTISLMMESLHIAKAEWWNANRILKSINQSGTNNNDINVLRATNAIPKGIKLNHFFTSPRAWFVRTNCPNGMTAFWRERPTFGQDNDFDTKNAKAGTYMRFSVGCTDPRGIYGSNPP